jgi:hypothetical protein
MRKSLLVLSIAFLTGTTSLPTSAWAMGSDMDEQFSTSHAPAVTLVTAPEEATATPSPQTFDTPQMFDEMLNSPTFDPTQISSLKLSFTPTEEQFSRIASLTGLHTLDLFDLSSDKRPMKEAFLTALAQKPLLDTISLHYCKLTQASFAALTQNPHLRNIHLDTCGGLTEAAAIALAEKPGLNSLHLPGWIEITDAFYAAAAQNPSLRSVEPSKQVSRLQKLNASIAAERQADFDLKMSQRSLQLKFIY